MVLSVRSIAKELRHTGLEWMGRYRLLVAALILHTNLNFKEINKKLHFVSGVELKMQEWQVLEYIIENEDDSANMNIIAEKLGIPQSSFSKIIKHLCELEFIDKYQTTTNRKNIILKVSERGRDMYDRNSSIVKKELFAPFFDSLSDMSDAEIEKFTAALNTFNKSLDQSQRRERQQELIKLQKKK